MKKNIKKLIALTIAIAFAIALTGCGEEKAEPLEKIAIDPKAETLTITGPESEDSGKIIQVVYTAEDIEAMNTKTVTYSGRSKKVNNERIFQEKTGVDLEELLVCAGFDEDDIDDAVLKVTCSDEYINEYQLDDINDDKYSYRDNASDDRFEVRAMIALEKEGDMEYPSPFQIVFGQAEYDTFDNSAQDFNMQNWGSYIQLIEVSFPDDED